MRAEFNVPVEMMNETEMRQLLKAILARASRDDAAVLFAELIEAEFSAFGPESHVTSTDILTVFNKASDTNS